MFKNYVSPMFKKIKTVVVERLGSTAADSTTIVPYGNPVTLHCSTGNLWVAADVAATTANGFKMYEGMTLDIGAAGYISTITDTTTTKYQAIIWEA